MKVNIGKHPNWFGPYQLAEALCFWVKEVEDKFGSKNKPDWVHKFGEFLAHGSIEPEAKVGEITKWDSGRHDTFISKFLTWVHSKKKQKKEIHIDPWDTWNMYYTLAPIILPMLKQLKVGKQGYPTNIDINDLPKHLQVTDNRDDYEQMWLFEMESIQDGPSLGEQQWDWIIDEMIFAFEHIIDDTWEEKYHSGVMDLQWEKIEGGMSKMLHGPNHTYECDYAGLQIVHDRIGNGFVLFGKYYRNLWD